MTTTTYELELAWPITDRDMALDALKAEARADLTATLAAHGLARAGNPLMGVTHGTQPAITARLLVTGPPGLEGPIEATQAPDVTQGADAA